MTSIIAESASIAEDVSMGHFCVIGENVTIGVDCRIGHHVIIHDDTEIGEGCIIDDHAVLGKAPLRSRSMALDPTTDLPPLRLSDRVVIGTSAIVFRGSTIGQDGLVADLASVREESSVGDASIVGRGVAVENKVRIGARCKIEAGAFICAFTEIGDDCFIAPEVTLTNDNYLGRTEERKQHYAGAIVRRGGRIGANATILPGRRVGENAVAGAGSVVTKDISPETISVGVPSRSLKGVPPEQRI